MKSNESFPLSPMQHGMVFHTLYARQGGVEIEQIIGRLYHACDIQTIFEAWRRVVARHGVLRTSFHWQENSELCQRVESDPAIIAGHLDWRAVPQHMIEARLEAWLREDRANLFDLSKAPLIRINAVELGSEECRVVWTFHHAILDGRSYPILLNEFFAIYEGICEGRNLALSSPRPYREYVAWLATPSVNGSSDFWRNLLSGITQPTLLAKPERGSGSAPSFRQYCRSLSRTLSDRLRVSSQRDEVTLHTYLQGAWAVVLGRYLQSQDVVFGGTRACRHSIISEAESMLGLFINTVPVRVRLPGDVQVAHWLRELRAQQIAVREFEHTPLTGSQACSGLPAGTPLFDSLVVFEKQHLNTLLRAQGGEWLKREFELREQPMYPAVLAIYADSEILLKLIYDPGRLDDSAAHGVLESLESVLDAFATNTDTTLCRISLVSNAAYRSYQKSWNRTPAPYPRDKVLAELFEEQVIRAPEKVAVEFGSASLTYRDLNARANQLAHYLRVRGVGPESLVGVCVERSIEMVVAVLGVVKAGGAYVPLDAGYPAKRLEFMLADTGVGVVLTQQRLLDRLVAAEAAIACLDRDWPEIATHSDINPPVEATADNLAYVMYTSGSTGEPKGVAVPQRAIVRLVKGTDYVQLQADDVVGQASNFSFDAATFEIWGALLNGGRLVGMSKDVVLSPGEFASQLEGNGITAIFLTTALFNELARQKPLCFRHLRHLLFGGELVDVRSVHAVLNQGPPQRLLHVYGPTECTTFATWQHVQQADEDAVTIPIGQPIANTCGYVLDGHGQPVPAGIPGELYLGGDGLARGYWRRPELTAERFVTNPNCEGRLYRTGDLVRRLENGSIEFLGRIDHQVKIRGFRVEPGEVESLLARHEGVKSAAVVVREDTPGEKRIVAYVVANCGGDGLAARLHADLAEQLPAYMMPGTFVLMPALPLNENGKVNRAALPAPATAQPDLFEEPQTAIEVKLAAIWTHLLGMQRVGRGQNFFEAGGHSLTATRLTSRIREVFQTEIPVRSVFDAPTLSALASLIGENTSAASPAIRRLQRVNAGSPSD